jgi:hypothetical protein
MSNTDTGTDTNSNTKVITSDPDINTNTNANTTFNVDKLLAALDNDNNERIMNLTNQKIQHIKNKILQQLGISGEKLKSFHNRLKQYRYVADLGDLSYGSYIRWIPLTNPDKIYLTTGGIVLDIKFLEDGVQILCKNRFNRIFQIKFDNVLIFQKLNQQENILLSVIDHLSK